MKISFIIPTWHYLNDPFKLQPYWELYYGTIIKNNISNSNLKIYDLRGKSRNNNFESFIRNRRRRFLYWIMKSGDAIEIYSIVDYLKKKFPKSKHIAGGTHVDMLPEETSKIFDSIVIGPEESFEKLLRKKMREKNIFKITKNFLFMILPFQIDRSYQKTAWLIKICLNSMANSMLLWSIFQGFVFITVRIAFITCQINYNQKIQN